MAITQEDIRKIVQMRGMGYSHQEIADRLEISRKTVENHLRKFKQQAEEAEDDNDLDAFFWGILIGAGAYALFSHILDNKEKNNQSHRYNYKSDRR